MYNLLTADQSADLSIARAALNGHHPASVSKRCLRAYYVLDGQATIRVGSDEYQASAGDVVVVPKGTEHELNGHATYIVINTPAFNPQLD